jgi:hypothetical protein
VARDRTLDVGERNRLRREGAGSSRTRTAYFCDPYTSTWATPLSIEIRCAMSVSAYSSTVESGSVFDVIAM